MKIVGILRDALRTKSVGVIEEIPDKGIVKYAKPAGVIAGLLPVTNPVVTMVGMPPADSTIAFNGLELFLDAKQIRVSNMGSSQIRRDFPRYVALAETGRLDIASMISRRIVLDYVNDAFRSMDAGEVIRTVIT